MQALILAVIALIAFSIVAALPTPTSKPKKAGPIRLRVWLGAHRFRVVDFMFFEAGGYVRCRDREESEDG